MKKNYNQKATSGLLMMREPRKANWTPSVYLSRSLLMPSTSWKYLFVNPRDAWRGALWGKWQAMVIIQFQVQSSKFKVTEFKVPKTRIILLRLRCRRSCWSWWSCWFSRLRKSISRLGLAPFFLRWLPISEEPDSDISITGSTKLPWRVCCLQAQVQVKVVYRNLSISLWRISVKEMPKTWSVRRNGRMKWCARVPIRISANALKNWLSRRLILPSTALYKKSPWTFVCPRTF